MKTVSKFSALAYEAPQAELLHVCVERNLLATQTGSARGSNITYDTESDFDDFFDN